MASRKLYRVKEINIYKAPKLNSAYIELAFKHGYVFIQEEGDSKVYMISTTVTKKRLKVELVEVERIY